MDGEEQWTGHDDVEFRFHALPDAHPANVVRAFVGVLWDDAATAAELAQYVTPESLSQWSDFGTVRNFVRDDIGVAIGSNALRAVGAPDVTFVKLVPDDEDEPQFHPVPRQDVRAWVTLVWRPELGGWRLHAIGEQLDPNTLPRTSPGDAPDIR